MEHSSTVRAAAFALIKRAQVLWECIYVVAQVATSVKTDHAHREKGTALLNEITSLWCAPFIGILACVYVSAIANETSTVKTLGDLFDEQFDIARNLATLPQIFLIDGLKARSVSKTVEGKALHAFTNDTFLPSITALCCGSFRIKCLEIFFTAPLVSGTRREAIVKAMFNQELAYEKLLIWRELCRSGSCDTKVFAASLLLHGESGRYLHDDLYEWHLQLKEFLQGADKPSSPKSRPYIALSSSPTATTSS